MWLKAVDSTPGRSAVGLPSAMVRPRFRARRNDTYRTLTTLLQSHPCQRVTL